MGGLEDSGGSHASQGEQRGSVVCNRVKRKDDRKLTTNENGSLDYYKILLGNHVILIRWNNQNPPTPALEDNWLLVHYIDS